jgi:prepilin-type N-terminal cleavage/methylation domain-containing protein
MTVAGRISNGVSERRFARGFSLTELLVSIAVLGILLIISVPTLMRAYRSYQLNDAASRFSGMLKTTRFSAIRKNTTISCKVQQNGAFWTIWTDLDGDGNPGPTEPQIIIGDVVSLLDGGSGSMPPPDAIVTAVGSGSPSLNVLSPGNTSVTYDQRGARKFGGAPSVDVFYLGNTSVTDLGYRAIVLLPSGTVQVWTAGPGGQWQRIS